MSKKLFTSLIYSCLFASTISQAYVMDENPVYTDSYANDTTGLSNSIDNVIGRIDRLYNSGNYLEAIRLGKSALKNLEGNTQIYPGKVARIHGFLGRSYYLMDELSLTLWHYQKSAEQHLANNDSSRYMIVESNRAAVQAETGDIHKAFPVLKKIVEYRKANRSPTLGHTYVELARLHLDLDNFHDTKLYLDSALEAAADLGNLRNEAYAYLILGDLNSELNNTSEAINSFQKSIDAYSKLGALNMVMRAVASLCLVYRESNQHNLAIELGKKYLIMADTTFNINNAILISDNLFESYKAIGNFKAAIDLDEFYRPLKDSLNLLKSDNAMMMGRVRQQADSEIQLLKKEDEANQQTIQFQNLLLIVAIVGIVLLIVVSIVIYRAFIINKRLSKINKAQSERLRQLDEAKSRFFANISHDLRTPLSLMMGSIDQVLQNQDVYLTEKAERQLKTGIKNGKRIIHLTNEINELIKLEDSKLNIKKEYVNLDEMLVLFVSMFHSMADMREVKLSYSKAIFDEKAIVSIDVNQFEKVLFNLMTNALKHTKKGDFVTIALAKADSNNLIISIIDSGEGIPEENVPYIFERYYQAPKTTFKSHEGFGIGLALVKEIIDKHGFQINVKSKLNEGTEFNILLPLEKVRVEQISKPHGLDYSDETRKLFKDLDEVESTDRPVVQIDKKSTETIEDKPTILVVEDHPEVRQYITDIIEPHYRILTAGNGKRALKVLESQKEIDLIITDLMMPWFDGFQLLETLKDNELYSKIPVLVLSARTSEKDKQRVLEQGVNDFLYKPFESKELLARIQNLLSRKSKWDSSKSLFINDKKTLNDIEKSLLEKVENMIMERIDDPNLSVGYLAQEIAVSERKFFRMIKKLTGSTPFEYIKEIRLQYANKLITEKRISTSSEAAKQIGMNNVSHFNNQFKSRFGKKPTEVIDSVK